MINNDLSYKIVEKEQSSSQCSSNYLSTQAVKKGGGQGTCKKRQHEKFVAKVAAQK